MSKGLSGFQKGNKLGNRFKKGDNLGKIPWNKWIKKEREYKEIKCKTCEIIFKIDKNSKAEIKRKCCSKKCSGFYKGHPVSIKIRKKISKANKGCIAWNKGIQGTHFSPQTEFKKGCISVFKNKKRPPMTKGCKIKISNSLIGKMPKNNQMLGKYGNIKRGWFDIGNRKMFFRSKWEANYAIYLNFLIKQKQIKKWEYEKDIFIFNAIQFGIRSYRPDFKIFNNNGNIEYHEVKGYMDRKSVTKMKRMAKYYPNIKLILIEEEGYNDIKKKVGKMLNFY